MNCSYKYASFFENLSKVDYIDKYKEFFDEDSYFEDPFHKVKGVKNIYDVFQSMYKKVDKPRFEVIEIVENKDVTYIKWNFYFYFKNEEKLQSFEGLSRVVFTDENKVKSHVDYWDSVNNLYEKIPILAKVFKVLKSMMKA